MSKELQNCDDLASLIAARKIVAVTTYRGDWCPFCRSYLKSIAKLSNDLPADKVAIYGVAADPSEKNTALKRKLELPFELVADQGLLFHHEWQAPINQTHGKAKQYQEKAFLQPAFYIFKNGELVFDWKQTPKLLNLGGAASRIPVQSVMDKIHELLD